MLMTAYVILALIVFFMGASIFSFLNVIVYRMPRDIPFTKGRSFCPKCNHGLNFLDMIPVFGYIFLKGKCRYCGDKISPRYPFIELLGGILALVCYFYYGNVSQTICVFLLGMALTVIALIDIDTMEIYDVMNGVVCFLGCISYIFFPEISIMERVIGFFVISVPLLLITLVIPGAFGGGDMKLMAACGCFLGWKNTLVAFFIALLLGGGYGAFMLASRKMERKEHFAFGPFLCVGVFMAVFIGDKLLNWYLQFFV